MIERIGINAGLVWNALDSLGKMDIKALRKATKLLFDESGEDLLIELIY